MDPQRVTPFAALTLFGYLALGLVVGAIYFAAMWQSAQLFAGGKQTARAIALVTGRFALIVLVLGTVAVRGGGGALLACALGFVIARWVAVRRVRALMP